MRKKTVPMIQWELKILAKTYRYCLLYMDISACSKSLTTQRDSGYLMQQRREESQWDQKRL